MKATIDKDLNDVLAFTQVVESGTFTAAARSFGVPTSTMSRRIARLEERLGARLLQRSTRRLSLTDAGRVYHQRCADLVEQLDGADRAVRELQASPRGLLRVTAPPDTGPMLWPVIDEFLSTYPEVSIELELGLRKVDLVEEGFDIAIRGDSDLRDSSLVAKKLADSQRVLVASPAYIEAHGMVERPRDLKKHQCILFEPWTTGNAWTLVSNKKKIQVPVRGRVRTNDFGLVKSAAISGLGIAQHLFRMCRADIERGALVELCAGACLTGGSVWVLYPSRKHPTPALRAFVDLVSERINLEFEASPVCPASKD